jgi:type IV pilus assembly protein PilV
MLMAKCFFKNQHNGSSLIEVLITMIVISLGLLGQAALTAQSSKANNSAFMRSQATLLAHDMIERLRLNRALAVAGEFSINFAAAGNDPSDSVPAGTTIQLTEKRDWKSNIEQALPAGDGQVAVDGTGKVTITIRWSEVVKASATDGAIVPTDFSTQSFI